MKLKRVVVVVSSMRFARCINFSGFISFIPFYAKNVRFFCVFQKKIEALKVPGSVIELRVDEWL